MPIQITLIIIGVAIIIILLWKRKVIAGGYPYLLEQANQKKAHEEQALQFISQRGQASNEEIREHLGVSRRSVVRYLDDLEKTGKVEQVGDIGRSVIYRIKQN